MCPPTVGHITNEVPNNYNNTKGKFEKKDTKLKKDLCELEGSVTAYTAAIPDLWAR